MGESLEGRQLRRSKAHALYRRPSGSGIRRKYVRGGSHPWAL